MASWIAKPWIEQALTSKNGKNLPKIARAQILKIEETSHNTFAFISDKKFFVKAVFSQAAVEHFKRDNPTLSMPDIQGGLIFIKKYSLQASCRTEKDLGNDITEICKKNLSAAMTTGRKDLVQTWSLMSLILDKKLAPSDSMDESPWALHPFGKKMVSSLMEYYLSIRDIQTLGMLSCVLAHHSLPDSFKPPKSVFKPEIIPSSKSFTFGSSPSYNDTPSQSVKRPKSLSNVTDHSGHESPSSEWSEVTFPISGGWSPPVFIRTKDPREEQRKQYEKDCRFVDATKLPLHDHYIKQYADVLYRWNLLGKRAEVIKFLSESQQPHSGVEFSTRCHSCSQKLRGAQCWSCKAMGLQCVICHVAVRGASNFCVACGHGGHTYHLKAWFEKMDVCPSGCGCRCLEVGTFIVD